MAKRVSNPEISPEEITGLDTSLSLEFIGGQRNDDEPRTPAVGYLAIKATINSANEALFFPDSSDRHEIPHQGSALIVSMLQGSIEASRVNPEAETRGVCFFDTRGNFYPFAKPLSVDLVDKDDRFEGVEMKKHSVRFLMTNQNPGELAERVISIDSIHAIAASPYRLQSTSQPL